MLMLTTEWVEVGEKLAIPPAMIFIAPSTLFRVLISMENASNCPSRRTVTKT